MQIAERLKLNRCLVMAHQGLLPVRGSQWRGKMPKNETRALIRCKKGAIKGERLIPGNSKTRKFGEFVTIKVPPIFLSDPNGHHTAWKLPGGKEPKPGTKARIRYLDRFKGPVPSKHKVPLSEFTLSKLSHFPTPKGGQHEPV